MIYARNLFEPNPQMIDFLISTTGASAEQLSATGIPMLQGNSVVTSNSESSAKSAEDYLNEERVWNAEQARLAYERSVDFEKHKYKYWVDSLKEAGLNPILATGLGGSVSSPSAAYSGFSSLKSSETSAKAVKYSADKNLVAQVASSSINAFGNVLSSFISGSARTSAAKIMKRK